MKTEIREAIAPRERPARREHRRGIRLEHPACLRGGQDRVAGQVFVLQDDVPAGVRVVGPEPVAPVVADLGVLRLAAGQFHLAGVRLDADVPAAHVERLTGLY